MFHRARELWGPLPQLGVGGGVLERTREEDRARRHGGGPRGNKINTLPRQGRKMPKMRTLGFIASKTRGALIREGNQKSRGEREKKGKENRKGSIPREHDWGKTKKGTSLWCFGASQRATSGVLGEGGTGNWKKGKGGSLNQGGSKSAERNLSRPAVTVNRRYGCTSR